VGVDYEDHKDALTTSAFITLIGQTGSSFDTRYLHHLHRIVYHVEFKYAKHVLQS
jgi:hypothetical protein